MITESGGIGPLVALLGGSNPKARENAEGALVRLSTEMANRVLIIKQLVDMLQEAAAGSGGAAGGRSVRLCCAGGAAGGRGVRL